MKRALKNVACEVRLLVSAAVKLWQLSLVHIRSERQSASNR